MSRRDAFVRRSTILRADPRFAFSGSRSTSRALKERDWRLIIATIIIAAGRYAYKTAFFLYRNQPFLFGDAARSFF